MKNIAIIGVSSFSYYLCKSLSKLGFDLMVIDISEDKINQVKSFARKAVIGDAKDKNFLLKIGIKDFDLALVSIGERIDVSILITLYLKEIGIEEIVVKAENDDHSKILYKIGASRVVFPEKEMAERMSHTISSPNFLEYIQLTEGFSLVEISPFTKWQGYSLKNLDLRKKYNIQVVMIRELLPERIVIPDGDFILKDSDIMYILGSNENIDRLYKEN